MPESNLIPTNQRTKDEQREITRKGGIASGKARRKKKMVSEIYASFLADKFKVKDSATGAEMETTGEKYLTSVIKRVLNRGDSASVSMIKEIREATEGTDINLKHSGEVAVMTAEERKARIAELLAKANGLD